MAELRFKPDDPEVRAALCDWIEQGGYTHAVTLNTEREMSLGRLKTIFSQFCLEFDRRVLALRNLREVPATHRIRAFGVPERLATNAHLHCHMDFSFAARRLGDESRVLEIAQWAWLKSNRGAGSAHIKPLTQTGFAQYSTKDFRWNGGEYLLSLEFHPR